MLYESVTAKSVRLIWRSGHNGGFPQTFSIEKRLNAVGNFMILAENVPDPGLGEPMKFMALDLLPSTQYQFRVNANNTMNAGSSTFGDIITVTTLGKQ
jgi:hypothetical protein